MMGELEYHLFSNEVNFLSDKHVWASDSPLGCLDFTPSLWIFVTLSQASLKWEFLVCYNV